MASLLQYTFSNQTVAPPTSNQVRLNGVGIAATLIWVAYMTTDGLDAFYILNTLPVDTVVVVQDKNDHTLAVKFRTTAAPIDHGAYTEIAVVGTAATGAPLNNNQNVVLAVVRPADVAPTPPLTALITREQAIDHLRLPLTVDDVDSRTARDLTVKIAQAESLILDYLKIDPAAPPAWLGTDVPPLVQAAALVQLAELWRFRGDDSTDAAPVYAEGQLSPQVTNYLRRYRDPALAAPTTTTA